MSAANIETALVPFHGEELVTVRHTETGEIYASPRQVSDAFGLDWSGQYTKLKNNQVYAGSIEIIPMELPVGKREIVMIPVSMFGAFLMSINANKVRPEYRNKLILWQRESSKVIMEYWMRGVPAQPPITPFMEQMQHLIVQMGQSMLGRVAQGEYVLMNHEERLARLERPEPLDYVTVVGYGRLQGRRLSLEQCQAIGRIAKRLCREKDVEVRPVPDTRHGKVGSYPLHILHNAIEQWENGARS